MRLLLTGASGFLGKEILKLCLNDDKVQKIIVVTRKKTSHPNSKVQILRLDLSDPTAMNELGSAFDAVIHLAGLYEFHEPLASNYIQNVLSTINVVEKLKELNTSRYIPLLFASTYAVGFGLKELLAEQPLKKLPSKEMPYAYTKAIAEQYILDSTVPAKIFRLGILVGRSKDGSFEKMEGVYSFIRAVYKLAKLPGAKFLSHLFIPADPQGILPLVPVDSAASIFIESLFKFNMQEPRQEIFGVYNNKSIQAQEFCEKILEHFLTHTRAVFLKTFPKKLLRIQERLTQVPEAIFSFSMQPVPLTNERFLKHFGTEAIPLFEHYGSTFLQGFMRYMEGKIPC